MSIVAARQLRDGVRCFVGIGLPSLAANLARRMHAPNLTLVYESGTIGAKPRTPPLSIGDGELAETADEIVSIPELFAYWLQGGRIDVGFLSAAQIDRFGNLNSTVIGSYEAPRVRLPGAGGAPQIAAWSRSTIVVMSQSRRTFVEKLDFCSTIGHGDGPGFRSGVGFTGAGISTVVTDVGVLEPDKQTRELFLTEIHPGVKFEDAQVATGWPLRRARSLRITPAPTVPELTVLRELAGATASEAG